jgi:hypothetical protein
VKLLNAAAGWFTLLLPALLLAPAGVSAQKPSEKAMVMQQVAGVDITIEYHRPVARGRPKLFGGVVHFGETWTPGANWATTFEVSSDITLNGQTVPKGKYSMWMVPADTGRWVVFLNNKAKRWHTERPKSTDEDVVRFTVTPEKAPPVEVLTFSFPNITKEGASLRMQWGETVIPLEISLTPIKSVQLSAAERTQYIGEYRLIIQEGDMKPDTNTVRIVEKGEALRVLWGSEAGSDEFYQEILPLGEHRFILASYSKGALRSASRNAISSFIVSGGKAVGFTLMNDGKVTGQATRLK